MTTDVLRCRLCREPMQYVHGHAACLASRCPLFGLNQAACCEGETEVPGDASPRDAVARGRPVRGG